MTNILNRTAVLFSVLLLLVSPLYLSAQDTSTDAVSSESSQAEASKKETSGGSDPNGIPTDEASITAGAALFKQNCFTCHAIDKKKTGPKLKDVYNRVPSIDWIKSFVRNPAGMIQSDEYAKSLFDQYKPTVMRAFSSLTDEEIMQILAYVKSESEKAPEVASADPTQKEDQKGLAAEYLNAILIGIIVVLVLLLITLSYLVTAVKRMLDQRDLTEEDKDILRSPYTFNSVTRSPAFMFIVVFIVVSLGFKAVINGLFGIGVQQGYAPKQPIPFSHKIHAGDYQIDCKYCHTGVLKGKNANIPSANICMNCHNQIKSGTTTGDLYISKIVQAVETNTPIEWVRVHNLPDLAYFNHSQHVKVGGVECQTCHGPIEEMEVVKQHALLTMGWCIDCHRKTDIKAKGNDYYDKLEELHADGDFKVEDNGGLECSKCHY